MVVSRNDSSETGLESTVLRVFTSLLRAAIPALLAWLILSKQTAWLERIGSATGVEDLALDLRLSDWRDFFTFST